MDAFGQFVGVVETKWNDPDREMELLRDFAYVDPSGFEWKAPRGSTIDGASIPRPLWSIVGSPFTGEYRNASVVHDVACDVRGQPWKEVHRMFYYACRCGGVGKLKAKMMFGAVYHFGPHWDEFAAIVPQKFDEAREVRVRTGIQAIERFVNEQDPSLDEIEAFQP
jgi:uncharacterized protein DUF1353